MIHFFFFIGFECLSHATLPLSRTTIENTSLPPLFEGCQNNYASVKTGSQPEISSEIDFLLQKNTSEVEYQAIP
jgi:hypothetical protein